MVISDPLQKYLALGNILADSAAKICREQSQTKELHQSVFDQRRQEEKINRQLCEMLVECNL